MIEEAKIHLNRLSDASVRQEMSLGMILLRHTASRRKLDCRFPPGEHESHEMTLVCSERLLVLFWDWLLCCMLQGISSACKMVRGSLNGLTFLAFLSLFSLSSKEPQKLWCLSHTTGMTRRTNSKHSVQLSFIYILHTLPFILHLEAITVSSLCFMLQGEGPAISETNRWLPYEQVGGNSGKEEFPLNRKRSLPSTVAGGGGRVQLKEMRKKVEHWETRIKHKLWDQVEKEMSGDERLSSLWDCSSNLTP